LLTILVLMNYAKSMAELFTFIALLATAASLFTYLFCALAALRLQMRGRMDASIGPDRRRHRRRGLFGLDPVRRRRPGHAVGPRAAGWRACRSTC
jgi:amino acid transporter